MPPPEAAPAVFLDRDGILNELVFYDDTGEWESPRDPEALTLRPGAAAAVAALRSAGWPVFLVSNQPSFAKGKTSLEALAQVHARLRTQVELDGAYYCLHHPHGVVPGYSGPCPCRKPSPFLLAQAARSRNLDLARSWMVGDQDMDILCGRRAGCRTLLIPYGPSAAKRGGQTPDALSPDLAQILPVIGMPAAARRLEGNP